MNRTESLQSSGWTYNSKNELLFTPLSSSGSTGGSSYVYDANGNTIQKNDNCLPGECRGQIQNYVYDVDNRLIEVKDASNNTIAKYTYDPFGRRVKKELGSASPANAGGIIYYLYSDEGLIGEYDATGAEIKTYGYKPDSTWGTDPLFMRESGNIYFYHNDHLGTPQKLTNISGAVVWSATYDAFGKAAIDASSTITSNLRFPGQYFDAETGLHYNWHRYYDSNTGRYVTEDPIGIESGDFNLYRYVLNNPLVSIDETGLYDAMIDWLQGMGALVPPPMPSPSDRCRKKGETIWDCADRLAKQQYGELFFGIVDNLGVYSAISAGVAIATTFTPYGLKAGANQAMSYARLRNALAMPKGHLLSPGAATNAGGNVVKRIAGLKSLLAGVSKASGVLALTASGLSYGLRALYIPDCQEECCEY